MSALPDGPRGFHRDNAQAHEDATQCGEQRAANSATGEVTATAEAG
jgi:hypothetical protein